MRFDLQPRCFKHNHSVSMKRIHEGCWKSAGSHTWGANMYLHDMQCLA